MYVASNGLCTEGCIGARLGQGVAALEPTPECSYTITLWWTTGKSKPVNTHEALGIDYVRFNKLVERDQWRNVSFIQFLFTNPSDYEQIRKTTSLMYLFLILQTAIFLNILPPLLMAVMTIQYPTCP